MKFKGYILGMAAASLFGVGAFAAPVKTQAASHIIPRNLRGTWYNSKNYTLKLTAHAFYAGGREQLSSYWHGIKRLDVKKRYGWYVFNDGKYDDDTVGLYKLTHHDGRKALEYNHPMVGTIYYYK